MGDKVSNQSTDSANPQNKAFTPLSDEMPSVPASDEFNGHEFDGVFSQDKRAVSD